MAELPVEDRERIQRGLMRYVSRERQEIDISKSDLWDAIVATDVWIDDNQASYNAALPVEARDNLTLAQKTLLFMAVAAMRVGLNFLRALFGEVD